MNDFRYADGKGITNRINRKIQNRIMNDQVWHAVDKVGKVD
jgi:predicted RNase H-like nuclease